MSATLWLGTRKGLFQLQVEHGNYVVKRLSFAGHPVCMVMDDPRDHAVYCALNLGHFGVKLHRSDDRGETWTEIGVPTYPAVEGGKGPSLMQIWALEPAGPAVADGIWAGTIPGGLFRTTDRGDSWTLNTALWNHPAREKWFGGGADEPGMHSVAVDPRDPQHVLVAVSCAGVWRTRDGGESWEIGGPGMFAEYMPPESREDPNIQDPHLMVRCADAPDALWVQHHNGVFRSTDNAASWQHVTGLRPSSFGFAVAVHPHQPETAWFVPAVKDEIRIPVDGQLSVTRTRDGGRTCDMLTHGLPQTNCYDIIYRHALDVDDSGHSLAMGSTTGNVWTTSNEGDTWHCVGHHFPPVYVVRFQRNLPR